MGRILPVILFEFSEMSVARFQVETGRLLSATMSVFLYAVNTLLLGDKVELLAILVHQL